MNFDKMVETLFENVKDLDNFNGKKGVDVYGRFEYLDKVKHAKLVDLKQKFKAGKISREDANAESKKIKQEYNDEIAKMTKKGSGEEEPETLVNLKKKSKEVGKEMMDFIYLLSGIQSNSDLGNPKVNSPSSEKVASAKEHLLNSLKQLEDYEKDLPEKFWKDYPETANDITKIVNSIDIDKLDKEGLPSGVKKDSLGKVPYQKNGRFVWYINGRVEAPVDSEGNLEVYNDQKRRVSTDNDDGTFTYMDNGKFTKVVGDGTVKYGNGKNEQNLYYKFGKKIPGKIALKYNDNAVLTKNLNQGIIDKLLDQWRSLTKSTNVTIASLKRDVFGNDEGGKHAADLEKVQEKYNAIKDDDKESESKSDKLIDISNRIQKGGKIASAAKKELYAGASSDKVVAQKMKVPSIKKAILSAMIEQFMLDNDSEKIVNLGKIYGDSLVYLIPKEYVNKVKTPGSNKLEKFDDQAEYDGKFIYITKNTPEQVIGDVRVGNKKAALIPGKIGELKEKLFKEFPRGKNSTKDAVKELLDKNLKSSVKTFNY